MTRTREELMEHYDEVLDTNEATEKYEFRSFLAPFAFVTERKTGVKGTVQFQDRPRFYFGFKED